LGIPLPFAGEFEVVIMIAVAIEEMDGSAPPPTAGHAAGRSRTQPLYQNIYYLFLCIR